MWASRIPHSGEAEKKVEGAGFDSTKSDNLFHCASHMKLDSSVSLPIYGTSFRHSWCHLTVYADVPAVKDFNLALLLQGLQDRKR